jgi:hypothetical protein
MAGKSRARGSQLCPFAAALEQAHAEQGLELLERFRYRRLADRQGLRRALQAAQARHGEHALQMAKFDPLVDHALILINQELLINA